jgi:peptide-methionine (S)-S-oxide reductase
MDRRWFDAGARVAVGLSGIACLAGCQERGGPRPAVETAAVVGGAPGAEAPRGRDASTPERPAFQADSMQSVKANAEVKPVKLKGTPTKEAVPEAVRHAVFGAGCFWGVESEFRSTPGVVATSVGFMGGEVRDPSYKQVCSEDTGHVEVVYVEYDPAKVSYEQLLEVFWNCHNPTQVNRQGPDVGEQYRTVIFFANDEEKSAAEASRQRLSASGKYSKPVATSIEPAGEYWAAEEYHQQYLEKRGLSSCHVPTAE